MPTYLEQHLDLDGVPAWIRKGTARYKGEDPALATWLGHDMKVEDVEANIPVSGRADVEVTGEGQQSYPWRYVPVVERDELGVLVSHSW